MVKVLKKKGNKKKSILMGVVHIHSTFNNTIVSITDMQGNAVAWSSSGKVGFKGSKKSTPYAAQVATKEAIDAALPTGLKSVVVYVRGPGVGRESALRAIQSSDLEVSLIVDKTYHPHNGCRPPKRRRS